MVIEELLSVIDQRKERTKSSIEVKRVVKGKQPATCDHVWEWGQMFGTPGVSTFSKAPRC